MIKIDGSTGEGGGQIVRTALALSTITGKAFRVRNIRKGRKNPGLKPQHVHCVKALKELAGAKAKGNEKGSNELLFIPGKLKAKSTTIDIGTAGSITLLLQAVLLPSIFSTRTHTIKLIGGTDTKWSMPIDYFTNVLASQYRRISILDVKVLKRGYYPKGQGEVELKIRPEIKRNHFENLQAFEKALHERAFTAEKQHKLSMIKGISHASKNLAKAEVAERQARAAKNKLKQLNVPIEITQEYAETASAGSGITLWAIFLQPNGDISRQKIGANGLGERGKPAEKVGEEAANKLIKELNSGAPIDKHLADNIIPIMALARPSRIKVSEVTKHTKTNIWVAEQFLGKIFERKENIISSTWQA